MEGEIHGEPYRVGYYAPASASLIVPGNGRVLANREGYRQDAISAEAVVDRPVGARAPGSLGGVHRLARVLHRPRARGAGPDVARVRAPAGRRARWRRARAASAAATSSPTRDSPRARRCAAPLPFAFDATAVVHAREGFPIPYFQVADTGDPTGGAKAVLVAPRLDAFRLPALVLVDARLSREMRVARGAVTAFVDAFNVLNTAATLQVARDVELPALDRPREIVRPRLIRGGVSVRF